jgi:hypothetical protein
MEKGAQSDSPSRNDPTFPPMEEPSAIVCPVCGAIAIQEKCKVVCKSETCRGRVIMNCAEF